MTDTPARSWPRRTLAVGVVLLVVAGVVTAGLILVRNGAERPTVALEGLDDGALLNADDLDDGVEAHLRTDDPEGLAEGEITLAGEPLAPDFDADGTLTLPVSDLPDGTHELTVQREGDWQTPAVNDDWSFTIDTAFPDLDLDELDVAVGDEPVPVEGATDPDAEVEVAGQAAEVDEDGRFATEVVGSEAERVEVVATSPAGNATTEEVTTAWVPSRSDVEQVNGLHVSFHGWVSDELREPILELAEQGRINTVQLDLKDEGGHVGYATEVDRALELEANLDLFDLEEAVAELHARGVRVTGRIVAFADPIWAEQAWEDGDRDTVVQRPEGTKHVGRYAGFTSFAHEEVRAYHYELAEEAARAGVDDILWDYIRRPDGPEDEYYFGGLDEGTSPEEAIVEFTAEADERLAPYGVEHGASVYGIAATRPTQIAQDIPAMAEHLDYVAPMVYYSHWGPGEYGVDDPGTQVYDITHRSLEDFVEAVEGKRARVVPWLQDFQLGSPHGEPQVRDQIRAGADLGIDEWLMWNASVRYTTSAYDELAEAAPEDDEDVDPPGDGGVEDDAEEEVDDEDLDEAGPGE